MNTLVRLWTALRRWAAVEFAHARSWEMEEAEEMATGVPPKEQRFREWRRAAIAKGVVKGRRVEHVTR